MHVFTMSLNWAGIHFLDPFGNGGKMSLNLLTFLK